MQTLKITLSAKPIRIMSKRINFKLQYIQASANNNYSYVQSRNATISIMIYCHVISRN